MCYMFIANFSVLSFIIEALSCWYVTIKVVYHKLSEQYSITFLDGLSWWETSMYLTNICYVY